VGKPAAGSAFSGACLDEVFLHKLIKFGRIEKKDWLTSFFSHPFFFLPSDFQPFRHPLWSFWPVCSRRPMTLHVCVLKKLEQQGVMAGGDAHYVWWLSRPVLRAFRW
jgi:hypothetical protein